jgi:CheY-like chemotaxis protein
MTGRGRRVVVVDDDRDLRELVVQVLSEVGFESEGCADGRAALEALRRPGGLPAVVLLDLEMPVMNGWEFRNAQLEDPLLAGIPVVVASASDAASIPADAYLAKPYGIAELCEVLAELALRASAAA